MPGVNNELAVNMAQLQSETVQKENFGDEVAPVLDEKVASLEVVDAPLIRAFNLLREFNPPCVRIFTS